MTGSNVERRDGSSLRIFISYRRDDTQETAGRLYDRLADVFGESNVLKDVNSIPFGADYRESSMRLAQEADVVLVLIGSHWVGQRDDGTRRIDHGADLVRLEVEAALQHCDSVIPILVGNAAMPDPSDLPESLASVPFRHAARLRHDPDFRGDCVRLIQQLSQNVAAPSGVQVPLDPGWQPAGRTMSTGPKAVPQSHVSNGPEPATRAGEVREFGSHAMSFCWCPGGTYEMGGPRSTSHTRRNAESQRVSVSLTQGFWLARTVVTQGQWRSVMKTQPWKEFGDPNRHRDGADYPAVCISWDEAMRFCAALTETERQAGGLSPGWTYALPTEAQWEYACRAGTTSIFYFGDDHRSLEDYAWFDWNAESVGETYAHPVGRKPPNAWELFDMHGNVWEWCQDIHAKELQGGRDPYVSLGDGPRVIRGGSWSFSSNFCGSAVRYSEEPSARLDDLGFRVACVPS